MITGAIFAWPCYRKLSHPPISKSTLTILHSNPKRSSVGPTATLIASRINQLGSHISVRSSSQHCLRHPFLLLPRTCVVIQFSLLRRTIKIFAGNMHYAHFKFQYSVKSKTHKRYLVSIKAAHLDRLRNVTRSTLFQSFPIVFEFRLILARGETN